MHRVLVKRCLVELDGDEMARVMWSKIKEKLILPNVDVRIKYFDLSVQNRDRTQDQVTLDSAKSIMEHGTGVKCATITIDQDRIRELNLKKILPSPNGTLRNIIGGTVFREAIVCKNIPPYIPSWKKPIVIGRHAYADQYKASEINVHKHQKLTLTTESKAGKYASVLVNSFDDTSGVGLSMFNTKKSVSDFAHSCFSYSLLRRLPLYFTTKNTILKTYDGFFKDIFSDIYDKKYKEKFTENGIFYEHRLIDDMVAQCIKSDGGYVWACKNYDGDVMSDLIAQGFGSLGLMTSVLLSPNGKIMESEAAHGTVKRHYRLYKEGKTTSTNPVASIYAWTRGLLHLAKLEDNLKLKEFCMKLEEACVSSIEQGIMTKDLALCISRDNSKQQTHVSTDDFIDNVAKLLKQ